MYIPIVIFINVPPDIAYQLNKKKVKRGYLKGKQSDSAEKDFLHQKAAYKEYMYMVEHNRSWVKVDCVLRGVISSPNQIHEMVWKIVSKILWSLS